MKKAHRARKVNISDAAWGVVQAAKAFRAAPREAVCEMSRYGATLADRDRAQLRADESLRLLWAALDRIDPESAQDRTPPLDFSRGK